MKPEQFAGQEPRFVLEDYFAGRTYAWGIFEDRFGTVKRQFVVEMDGTWDGERLVLDEKFHYRDGEESRRVWRIRKLDAHTYEGEADDVVGTAAGRAFGNALNWTYDLKLKVGGSPRTFRFDDWMFLQPDGVLINRARMSKWGIEVGAVTLAFAKVRPAAFADAPAQAPAVTAP